MAAKAEYSATLTQICRVAAIFDHDVIGPDEMVVLRRRSVVEIDWVNAHTNLPRRRAVFGLGRHAGLLIAAQAYPKTVPCATTSLRAASEGSETRVASTMSSAAMPSKGH
jgi:hypothetical protein